MTADKLARTEGKLGDETVKELQALSPEDLKTRVFQSQKAIAEAKGELDALPEYQEAKENVKALSQGFRELKARQMAITEYAVHLLAEKGQ